MNEFTTTVLGNSISIVNDFYTTEVFEKTRQDSLTLMLQSNNVDTTFLCGCSIQVPRGRSSC